MRISDWSSDVCSSDLERLPDYQAMTVWCTSELPVNNDESAFNNGEAGPKGQRVLLRIGEMGPDAHSASVLHRTETPDYAVVLAGTFDKTRRASCRESVWQYV